MKFQLIKNDLNSSARLGKIETDHGAFDTPIFMPVATSAAIKGVHNKDLIENVTLLVHFFLSKNGFLGRNLFYKYSHLKLTYSSFHKNNPYYLQIFWGKVFLSLLKRYLCWKLN